MTKQRFRVGYMKISVNGQRLNHAADRQPFFLAEPDLIWFRKNLSAFAVVLCFLDILVTGYLRICPEGGLSTLE